MTKMQQLKKLVDKHQKFNFLNIIASMLLLIGFLNAIVITVYIAITGNPFIFGFILIPFLFALGPFLFLNSIDIKTSKILKQIIDEEMKQQFSSNCIPKIKVSCQSFILHTLEIVKPIKISEEAFKEFISDVNYKIAKDVGFNFVIFVMNSD